MVEHHTEEWNYETEEYDTIITYGIEDTITNAIPMEIVDKDDCEWLVNLFNKLSNEQLIERWDNIEYHR